MREEWVRVSNGSGKVEVVSVASAVKVVDPLRVGDWEDDGGSGILEMMRNGLQAGYEIPG